MLESSGDIRPMLFPLDSVNQTEPSGPCAMVVGPLRGLGSWTSTGRPSVAARRSLGASHRC
jgi:hypothetical protein